MNPVEIYPPKAGDLLDQQLSYWRGELAGAPVRLELPTDRPRPAVQSLRSATESFELPEDLREQLESAGQRQQVTLFTTVLTGFVALMHRYSGQEDFLVGTPVFNEESGRSSHAAVLRAQFTEQLNFRSLLRQMQKRIVGAQAHRDVSFDQLAAEFVAEPDPSHNPLFQVMFEMAGAKTPAFGLGNTDLAFVIHEAKDGLTGSIEYSTDLFESGTIRRMAGHYRMLLAAIAHDPDQAVSTAPMLTGTERDQLLYEWNDTRAEYPNTCAHELFEQQAAHNPEAIALVFREQQLSYGELNGRANQLAHYLRARGVGPDVLVGVCLERSVEMVVALMGIWKAGGAYVPLDPAYPRERLSFMLLDAAAAILVTDRQHEHLFASAAANIVCLDADWPVIAEESAGNVKSAVAPSHLAYVMYTSGSTGEPKGAMVHHSGLVNYLWWAAATYKADAGSAVPVHSSISFDLTVTALYPALITGGCIELLPEDVGAQNLVTALRRGENRSLVKITPAHLELLSQQFSARDAAEKTNVFVIGGENLLAESLHVWREFAPATRLINEYGPTETVVGCCVYEVKADDPTSGSVPIGRPIANTQLYILDRYMNPLPLGMIGELYIGGAGVAYGYLNRPELTRERFLPDPFSKTGGGRLYKTGDMVRYRTDGTIEYLGRIDNQVKVRGYRIELGEIEAALADHPVVKSCAVLAREDTPGNKQLVGYVIARKDEATTGENLREFLRQRLPEYMAPAQFVFLDSFPLTHNGKIDRKALPAPTNEAVSGSAGFVAPRTDTENRLAAIWRELLNVENIGVHDSFFDLGGHSLMAMRLASRIRDVFEMELPLATLLEAPTIAELAAMLRKDEWHPSWSSLVPIRAEGSRPRLFLMHSHGGNVLEYHPLVSRLDTDQPVYALQARGLDGHITKNLSLEAMASVYVDELRSLQPTGPYFLGGFCLGGLLALEAAQQLTAAGQEVALVIVVQSIHPESSRFKPNVGLLRQWGYRIAKRIDQERENLSSRGKGYALARCRHAWDLVCAKAAIAFNNFTGKKTSDPSRLPRRYILESLAIEHKRAMNKYVPRPYGGDVALFRASKQLSGLMIDESLGWTRVLRGGLDVCEVPGHQQTLLQEPNVSRLAQELSSRLKTAQRRAVRQ